MKACIILMIMMGFLYSTGFAQKKETVEELSNRVKILEGQKENLDKQGALLKDDLEKKFTNEAGSLDNKFKEQKSKLDNDYNYLNVLLWVFGPLTVIGIFILAITMLISYFKLRKKLEKVAEAKIREKFDQIFEEKKEQIKIIINKQDQEFQFKKEKRILILSPGGSNDFLEKFFIGEGFKKFKFAYPQDYLKIDLEDFNLVLLDNEEDKFMKGLIPTMVRDSREVAFVYFGPPTEDSRAIQNAKNIAFANYGAQLYGNLINALRYQKYLKD